MNIKIAIIAALALVFLTPGTAAARDKKKGTQRGMLERMQSIPCGVKQRGLTSLGGLYAGLGVQHLNSNEKLCPQYLFRTDEMDYHIRPMDSKHPPLLPIGQEAEFKIKKDKMYLRVADGDRKMRPYQVVGMEPVNSENTTESTSYKAANRPAESRRSDKQSNPGSDQARTTPPQQ